MCVRNEAGMVCPAACSSVSTLAYFALRSSLATEAACA